MNLEANVKWVEKIYYVHPPADRRPTNDNTKITLQQNYKYLAKISSSHWIDTFKFYFHTENENKEQILFRIMAKALQTAFERIYTPNN